MRLESWNPSAYDQSFEDVAVERLVKAANIVRAAAKRRLAGQIGRGAITGINRPVYRKGDYAGVKWTAREFGQLMKSIRVTRKKSKSGRAFLKAKNVRVYAGHYLAFYADIFEHYRPFMRPALEDSMPMIKTLIGVK